MLLLIIIDYINVLITDHNGVVSTEYYKYQSRIHP